MAMNIECKDRDRIFQDGTPAEWAALEAHGATCSACAEELRSWKSLSVAAQELRDYSDSPSLWPRIQRALVEQAAAKQQRASRWTWLNYGSGVILGWQVASVAALALILTLAGAWIYVHRAYRLNGTPEIADKSLLKSPALAEV
jgi:anti-sigma factor RsiW